MWPPPAAPPVRRTLRHDLGSGQTSIVQELGFEVGAGDAGVLCKGAISARKRPNLYVAARVHATGQQFVHAGNKSMEAPARRAATPAHLAAAGSCLLAWGEAGAPSSLGGTGGSRRGRACVQHTQPTLRPCRSRSRRA